MTREEKGARYERLYRWAVTATPYERAQARQWALDNVERAPRIVAMGGIAVISAVDHHYSGGWPAFLEANKQPVDPAAVASVDNFPYPRRMTQ